MKVKATGKKVLSRAEKEPNDITHTNCLKHVQAMYFIILKASRRSVKL